MPRAANPAAACRHCRLRKGQQAMRGLCHRCHAAPAVRRAYPTVTEGGGVPPSPTRDPEPTDAPPGSPAKVEVLRARLWAGERLYHRADARLRLE